MYTLIRVYYKTTVLNNKIVNNKYSNIKNFLSKFSQVQPHNSPYFHFPYLSLHILFLFLLFYKFYQNLLFITDKTLLLV